jgi:hypothetical protein
VDEDQVARGYFSIDIAGETEPEKSFPSWVFVLLVAVIASWFVVLFKRSRKNNSGSGKPRRYK